MSKVAIVSVVANVSKKISKENHNQKILSDEGNEEFDNNCILEDEIQAYIFAGEQTQTKFPKQKSICISTCNSLIAIAFACKLLKNGQFNLVSVQARSPVFCTDSPGEFDAFLSDTTYLKDLDIPYIGIVGLFHQKVFNDLKFTEEDTAIVVTNNKTAGLKNNGIYAEKLSVADYLQQPYLAYPTRKFDISNPAYAEYEVILATEEKAKSLDCEPVWIEGVSSILLNPSLEIQFDEYYSLLQKMFNNLEEKSQLPDLVSKVDYYEIDDTFSFVELMHLSAIGYNGSVSKLLRSNYFSEKGEKPVNLSGGSLGCGNFLNAGGLFRLHNAYKTLQSNKDFKRVLVSSSCGFPTCSYSGVILGK